MAEEQQSVEVRAKRAHLQPGTHQYRAEGETFTHTGELYKHVEPVRPARAEEPEETGDDFEKDTRRVSKKK